MSLAFGDTRMDDKRLLVVDILTLFAPFSHTYKQSTGNMEIVLELLIKSLICTHCRVSLIVPFTQNLQ